MTALKTKPTITVHESDSDVVARALKVLEKNMSSNTKTTFSQLADFKNHAMLQFSHERKELFGVYFLDSRNGLIKYKTMFTGTVSECTVYPREIIREALLCDATNIILVHNHPSGIAEPSFSDDAITMQIVQAANTVEIDVVDHAIISSGGMYSFAQTKRLDKIKEHV